MRHKQDAIQKVEELITEHMNNGLSYADAKESAIVTLKNILHVIWNSHYEHSLYQRAMNYVISLDNAITIDIGKINVLPDNSITDAETIRQIALYSIKTGDTKITRKVKKEFAVYGLYPEIMRTFTFPKTKQHGNQD